MHMNPFDDLAMRQYRERGYLAPFEAFGADEVVRLRRAFEAAEAAAGGRLPRQLQHKVHLVFDWADELVHHPAILDAVEALLGPNLLCWTTNVFAKDARSPSFVSWHQDAAYWGIAADDVVTAWVALTPSTKDNGCLRVVPGSHTTDLLEQRDTFGRHNLLTRGQEIAAVVDPATAAAIELAPGQFSLHHVKLVHGSEPNRSHERRIGLAIRYIPTTARKIGAPESAMLVRGRDAFGHWLEERRPSQLSARDARLAHNAAVARQARNNFTPQPGASLEVRARLALMRAGARVTLIADRWRMRRALRDDASDRGGTRMSPGAPRPLLQVSLGGRRSQISPTAASPRST